MSWAPHPQARPDGSLRHLLTLDGLPRRHLEHLLRWSERYLDDLLAGAVSATLPGYDDAGQGPLAGDCVIPMRFDAREHALTPPVEVDVDVCARAALALGADIATLPALAPRVSVPSIESPLPDSHVPTDAGSTRVLIDWLPSVVEARYLILQHPQNGAPFVLAAHCAPHQQIINAGDGCYARPIDALCSVLAMLRGTSALTERRVALVGDIAASAIARSLLHALTTLGIPEIRVVGPTSLSYDAIAHLGATWYGDPTAGLSDVDVVITLPAAEEPTPAGTGALADVQFMDGSDVRGRVSDVMPVTSSVLRQAVWMAVFAVLAGCTDENVGRVIGTARSSVIDEPGGTSRVNGSGGESR